MSATAPPQPTATTGEGADETRKAIRVLTMNTIAFAACFACWMMNGILITHLVINGVFDWDVPQVSILIATPILTGSLLRLPVGMLTDKYGGRIVYFVLMLLSAGALVLNSFANSYATFVLSALGFGLAGASFAVGVAYTSVWFRKERQGTALGIFGTGNAGTAITLMLAPTLLKSFTNNGANPDGWRRLPLTYAAMLTVVALLFWFLTYPRVAQQGAAKTLRQRLQPLAQMRVWRFGLYYFLVFGGFVALSNWLVPYYVKAYGLELAVAGFFATMFSLPTGLFRAVGGYLSDRYGARTVLYAVLAVCIVVSFALLFPRMEIYTPGEGILATAPGTIIAVGERHMEVKQPSGKIITYKLTGSPPAQDDPNAPPRGLILPKSESWQYWSGKNVDGKIRPFQVNDTIARRELIARGRTRILFEANVYIFTGLVLIMGIAMGIGMAAVYKHIPTYFPTDVGVVGGLVGVLGGLGGFFSPIIFGYLLKYTGVWTTCWAFFFIVSAICLIWMHIVIRRMLQRTGEH